MRKALDFLDRRNGVRRSREFVCAALSHDARRCDQSLHAVARCSRNLPDRRPLDGGRDPAAVQSRRGRLGGGRRRLAGGARADFHSGYAHRHRQGRRRLSVPVRHDAARRNRAREGLFDWLAASAPTARRAGCFC